MNRRQFINRSAAVLAAAAIADQDLLAAVAAKRNKGRIGIQLFSVRDELEKDFMGTLKKLSDIGYSSIEPYGFTEDNFFGRSMKELKQIAGDLGMGISGSHIWSGITINNTPEKEWDFWKQSADIMKTGGAQWVVLSSLPKMQTMDDLKRIADYFNRAGEICKKGGAKFAFHNHDEVIAKIDGIMILDYLIQNSDPKLMFFQLDLGHIVNAGGDCAKILSDHPKRIPLWHATDFDSAARKYTEVGKGSVPYPKLFELAKSTGLEQLIVEQETQGNIFSSCKVDFDYLKQFSWTKL